MMKLFFRLCIFLALFIGIQALAVPQAPLTMLQQTTDEMLSALKTSPDRSTTSIYRIVRRVLLPHVDLEVMSRSVVGANYWNQAALNERNEFKDQFTQFVTRTYSSALSSYKDEKVVFFPMRGSASGPRVQIYSEIQRANGQRIPVSYRLLQSGGQWKVYDFSVEGISMVENYRSQFDEILRQRGFTGLLNRLRSHNVAK